MELLLKPALFAALAGVILLFIRVIHWGRTARDSRVFSARIVPKHQKAAYQLWWAMLGFICLIEGMVRLNGGSEFDTKLIVHIMLAGLSFIGITAILFYFTGFKTKYHGIIAYISFILFLIAAYIGVPMIQSRF